MPSFRALDSALQTYNFSQAFITPAVGASDVWQVSGANLKTIKIRWIQLGGTAATARSQYVQVTRRGNPSTGGTSTNPVPRSADSTDAVAGAVATAWTANPTTLGTPAFAWDLQSFALVVAGGLQDRAIFNYEQVTSKPLTLNNSNECMAIYLGITPTVAGDRIDCSIWWTEQ